MLCTYNGARFLDAQWCSLLAQVRLPDEIIVRDDGSTDGTVALLETLRKRAETRGVRVDVQRNTRNLGYVENFSSALQVASGDVLFLCDQDDVWHPDKLATQLAAFERRPALLLLSSDARRVDASGRNLDHSLYAVLRMRRHELRDIHAGRGFEILLYRSMATGATVAFRRCLLAVALPFPEGWVHDEWLAIIAAACSGFDCEERELIDYRQHADNQIGMPERGLGEQWRDLLKPRRELLAQLIARTEILNARFGRLPADTTQAAQLVSNALAHWHTRQSLRGAPWQRLRLVVREALRGHYRKFGTGWHSALRDLVRRR